MCISKVNYQFKKEKWIVCSGMGVMCERKVKSNKYKGMSNIYRK